MKPGDVEGLASVVSEISQDRLRLMKKRENAFHYVHQHFGQDALAKQWAALLRLAPTGEWQLVRDGCYLT